jgi:sporulation protein YlmC with PRC-barrel domain
MCLRERTGMEVEGLRGRSVVSLHQAKKLGEIQDIIIDVRGHRIAALALRGGLFHGGPVILWKDVRTVGLDAVMVDDAEAAHQPTRDLSDWEIAVSHLHGRKVVADTGELVGTIKEVDVDSMTGNVTQYVVESADATLFHAGRRIVVPPRAVVAFGDDLVTVQAAAITQRPATDQVVSEKRPMVDQEVLEPRREVDRES